ncbi:nuclear intron maturase 4, mitochondrial isoform X1 [Syzygium oleosum]|uniref:nuclear intron maturase 4, mitochondrial isoform X1 n=2 Tax=Syzygium oleosum TaxID=219896 RepID=UPI0011D28767|nr:nuclear intron maturase 4, mitochondrial isoform X1 [Syzygium oleosum]XP_030462559.1 nuclear intron maturase 4, mitochondrial isoform X1 [Syzygium oleosum]XP_056159169.1 nuclear intron maturase 4, mitochondrial isoform X1 [Syzygium oleosum]XP_056159170.1 nuclear intron maturase 4, mitochondrial isoform X1 [Syzygium oleosum]XP_056159171.1 nuclear intron maturase 4, mitochondrial isoform X1 [Syzygium oleosum]
MALPCLRGVCRRNLLKLVDLRSAKFVDVCSSLKIAGTPDQRKIAHAMYSAFPILNNVADDVGKATLAQDLACLINESSILEERKPRGRMELKRFLELRIKKRVKKQYMNGKFHFLMENVVAHPETLEDAYGCIMLNSNVDVSMTKPNMSFVSTAKELHSGSFDVKANTYSISTRGAKKEVLILPNLKLKVVQEAIRIVLEVVYRPHFSKISHGCRSGRSHSTALKYICKEISNPDWWFTLHLNKKMDASNFTQLVSIMEEKIEDPCLCTFMLRMFEAHVLNLEFGGFPKGHGLPQEGILSPILMNIYLDQFDCEFFKLSMKYEALSSGSDAHQSGSPSTLRRWFQRQMKASEVKNIINGKSEASEAKNIINAKSDIRVYCCRVMDEIFCAVSGSEDIAINLMHEIISYMRNTLYLEANSLSGVLPCDRPHGIRFLGLLITRRVEESPAVRAVHKLKDKVKLFALQKETAWNAGTIRIGQKWLAHGLKKVKESEIRNLADKSSVLSQISCYRKAGMETDHWYKLLLKIWMLNVNAKSAESEEIILSRYVAEPSLPTELIDSFCEFQKRVDEYVASETASTLALLPKSSDPVTSTEINAPVHVIEKHLLRYEVTNSRGYARSATPLILQDSDKIIDWFSGIVRRCLRWFSECNNFNELKLIVCDHARKSCIRTLASKYRMHEDKVEKRFDADLGRIPSTQELDQGVANVPSESQAFDNDEALMYGLLHSGTCLLSLARITSQSRPCNCFVMGCSSSAPSVYTLNVMERQKFPGWKTGFSSCIHPSLNKRRFGLCDKHLSDLYLGHISLQAIDFGAWKVGFQRIDRDNIGEE